MVSVVGCRFWVEIQLNDGSFVFVTPGEPHELIRAVVEVGRQKGSEIEGVAAYAAAAIAGLHGP
jgi:hypothetical protein